MHWLSSWVVEPPPTKRVSLLLAHDEALKIVFLVHSPAPRVGVA